jgi:NitT/TauT family transport system ATP-binding protein
MIRLNQVSVEYRTTREVIPALRDISLEIGKELLTVVGPSGCGKSTLLRVLAGLVSPTTGSVEFDENGNHSYGIVFQDYSLLPWLTARKNIELGLRVKGTPFDKRNGVSDRLLNQLGLSDVAHLLPHQLSGGMRQRVAVGRAFAPSPSLLLMDEPFGALDAITREELQEVLASLYENQRHTIVFVTHDVEEALFLGDKVCVLTSRPGQIRELLDVPFARPRKQEIKRDVEFQDLKFQIEDMLQDRKTAQIKI